VFPDVTGLVGGSAAAEGFGPVADADGGAHWIPGAYALPPLFGVT